MSAKSGTAENPPTALTGVPVAGMLAPLDAGAGNPAPLVSDPAKRSFGERARETRSLRRADALVAAGQPEKALAHLRRLTQTVTGATRAALKMAHLLKETRRAGEALNVLRRAAREDAANPVPREALAELALEVGATDEAIESARHLMRLSPRSLAARDILSAAYLQSGLLPAALRMAQELCRLEPGEPMHHFKRGVLLQQMGRVPDAMRAYHRVLTECDPDDETDADDFLAETREAIELLDAYQLRQIAVLAVEDMPFRVHLKRDAAQTVAGKGFCLSPAGLAALGHLSLMEMPSPPTWRHRFYH